MSQENVDAVRKSYDALNRRDYDAWIALLDPAVELYGLPDNPDARVYRGHDEVRDWLASVWEVAGAAGSRFEPEHITDRGDFIIVSVRTSMLARGSTVPVVAQVFNVFEMAEGKARRVLGFRTEAEALAAVGPSEQDAHADS